MTSERSRGSDTAVDDSLDDEAPRKRGLHVPPGSSIGRYVILSGIGSGGAGLVYAAYDPELDRKVAVKVLRPRVASKTRSARARARLMREAQAMARLDHPAVISVHDVGTHGDEIFVAMEFVDGSTLREWAELRERTPQQIAQVYAQAGRGLAAAHAAGVIHRDFKPDNVMVSEGGEVRVLDFGLARSVMPSALTGDTDVSDESDADDDPAAHALPDRLTRTGALLGTPAYMAPEQFLGGEVDALSDQFSFCVALYEALYDQRPFPGRSKADLAAAVCAGKIRAPPPGIKVPARIRRVVVRGLATRPEDRHPSMGALIKALTGRSATTRWIGVAAAVAVVGGAVTFGITRGSADARACRTEASAVDSIWTPTRRAAVAERLGDGGDEALGPFATETIDAYATAWREALATACDATFVRNEQSEARLETRKGCLDAALGQLDATIAVLERHPPRPRTRIVDVLAALDPTARCGESAWLAALGSGDLQPTREAAHAWVRPMQTARIGAASEARRLAEATARTTSGPAAVRPQVIVGRLAAAEGDWIAARMTLLEAAATASDASDDLGAAEAWQALAVAVSRQPDGNARALVYLDAAETELRRATGTTRPTMPWAALRRASAQVHEAAGRTAAARTAVELAIDALEPVLGADHLALAPLWADLARLRRAAGDEAAAGQAIERAEAVLARAPHGLRTRFIASRVAWPSKPDG